MTDEKQDHDKVGIYCISDIHSEFYQNNIDDLLTMLKDNYTPKDANFCVLAGDIGSVSSDKTLEAYKQVLQHYSQNYPYVIFVAGNHEFYNSRFEYDHVIDKLTALTMNFKNVYFLHRASVILEDIRFVGATLWSDITEDAALLINDFRHQVFRNRADYLAAFQKDLTFLKETLQENRDSTPNIIVTHHLPTDQLVHPRFANHPIGSAFSTNILPRLNLHNTPFFFCGHTHETMVSSYKMMDPNTTTTDKSLANTTSIVANTTRLIVNPLGYPKELRATSTLRKIWLLKKVMTNVMTKVLTKH